MKALFISSGNSKNGISTLVHNQGMSIQELGHEVSFFTIKGKGIKGYFKHIFILRRFLKQHAFDVIHAHYSLSAIVAALAGATPLVTSLMGSDVKASPALKYGIQFFNTFFWKKVIVKSQDMKVSSNIQDAYVVPNGVDFTKFRPIPKSEALPVTGWDTKKQHILFAANPKRKEKNYALAKQAFDTIANDTIQLHALVDIPNELMPNYFNAADVILLTSLWEGSPNVIKEAMACNCKIVAVAVGDIKKVIGATPGCFVTDFNPDTVARKLQEALAYSPKTKGRHQVAHLDATTIAKQLIHIYTAALS